MLNVAIVTGSTRPGRHNDAVAQWVYGIAQARTDAEFEFVDIADFKLPLLDEPVPPSMGQYMHEHTKTWAKKIASFDGYVFVTPEYNHGIPGSLKNAIDFLNSEWANKAAGFVGYGAAGGSRAVEQLRLVLAELRVATVRAGVVTGRPSTRSTSVGVESAWWTVTPGAERLRCVESTAVSWTVPPTPSGSGRS